MADHTKIEWADATTSTKAGAVWNGTVRLHDPVLRWKRPRRIFWNAHGDLFHEAVPDEAIDRQFAVMALTPQHQHIVLTKRSARMREYCISRFGGWGETALVDEIELLIAKHGDRYGNDGGVWGAPLPNVWLGVSVEDQARADERIPDLLATPAAVRWISAEPLLGRVDLRDISPNGIQTIDALSGRSKDPDWLDASARLDWVVAGGESGPGARPMHPDWARSLRDQCAAAGVPFFFKQWGEYAPGEIAGEFIDPDKSARGVSLFDRGWYVDWSMPEGHRDDEPDVYRIGKKRAGDLLDGVRHQAWPA
jgi:protein gp37